MRVLLLLVLGAVLAAAEPPPVPDPFDLGPRLALLEHLQKTYGIRPPPGTELSALETLYRDAWLKASGQGSDETTLRDPPGGGVNSTPDLSQAPVSGPAARRERDPALAIPALPTDPTLKLEGRDFTPLGGTEELEPVRVQLLRRRGDHERLYLAASSTDRSRTLELRFHLEIDGLPYVTGSLVLEPGTQPEHQNLQFWRKYTLAIPPDAFRLRLVDLRHQVGSP